MQRLRDNSHIIKLLIIIVSGLFFWIARLPSLFEPYYYGDEMIYLSIGNGIRQGLSLYTELYDNKTPLLYLVAAISGNLFVFRLLSGVCMFLSVFFIFGIVRNLTKKGSMLPFYSLAISTVLLSMPIFEVFIANAENFFILPTSAAIYFLTRYLVSKKQTNLFFAGYGLGIAFLFKVPTIADFFATIGILSALASLNFNGIKKLILQSLIVFLGLITPITLTIIWFFFNNNLFDFLSYALFDNLGYSTSWSGGESTAFQLITLSLVFSFSVFVLWFLRKSGKVNELFVLSTLWLLGALTGALLSSRPYPHYLIQTLPALSIVTTILFFSSKKQQVYTVFVVAIYLFFIQKIDFWLYDIKTYKERVVALATYGRSNDQYLSLFGPGVVQNYEAAKIIKESTAFGQEVFIFGDSAPIYAMSNRLPPFKYTAYYHVDEFLSQDEICATIKNKKTPLVLIDKQRGVDCLKTLTTRYYVLNQTTDKYEFWFLATKE